MGISIQELTKPLTPERAEAALRDTLKHHNVTEQEWREIRETLACMKTTEAGSEH